LEEAIPAAEDVYNVQGVAAHRALQEPLVGEVEFRFPFLCLTLAVQKPNQRNKGDIPTDITTASVAVERQQKDNTSRSH